MVLYHVSTTYQLLYCITHRLARHPREGAGLLLGGEPSGHVIFRKYGTTGDGILTALRVAEIVLESKCPLSCLTPPE